jgi:D-aminoacyl-tRNA deacylase
MRALLQRVSAARVEVEGEVVGAIGAGLAVLIGVQRTDTPDHATRLAQRLLTYRIFDDAAGRMNLDVTQVRGGVLLVPQFTLAADTARGRRPGFDPAAPPDQARALFDALVAATRARHAPVEAGRFGAHMAVTLTNDGPVTFLLEV